MLKLNSIFIFKASCNTTSYVKVKHFLMFPRLLPVAYLNTSYVKVKPTKKQEKTHIQYNLNTSYVKVKLRMNCLKTSGLEIFKYILC